jgi:hypothetical protein
MAITLGARVRGRGCLEDLSVTGHADAVPAEGDPAGGVRVGGVHQLEVEVRLAGVAGVPTASDQLSDAHPVTFADGDRAALQGPSSNAYVWIELTNNCSTTEKVKIVISWGGDGDCWTLRPGAGRSWTYDGLGDYDKTVLC